MIDIKAEAEQILEDEHVESSVDAIIALCARVRADERKQIEREIQDKATEVGDTLAVVRGETKG